MKFLDLFSGIGGFRLGMEMAGHEPVGYVEFDKFARKSYEAMYDTEGEWTAHDITEVTDKQWRELRGTVDVITGGFPCQAFSVAGKRGGFSDTRGTLFFEIARAAEQIQPRFLFLENVKGLLSHDKGKTFETILYTLDELGYDAEWQVLNSKNFGVPQNRERVFIIGHLRGTGGREVFPIGRNDSEINTTKISKVGNIRKKGKSQSGDVVSPNGLAPTLCSTQPTKIIIAGELDIKANDQNRRVYDKGGISPSLTTMQGGGQEPKIIDDQGRIKAEYKKHDIVPTLRAESHGNEPKVVMPVLTPDRIKKRQNGRRFKEDGEPMFTLTSQDRHGVAVMRPVRTEYGKEIRKAYENGEIEESRHNMTKLEPRQDGISNTITTVQKDNLLKEDFRIRKLTPKECWRLQGFPDELFEKAQEVNSDSQLYKQAGNAVTVNVIYEIAKWLK